MRKINKVSTISEISEISEIGGISEITDESLQKILREASIPEPLDGLQHSRERLMRHARQQQPRSFWSQVRVHWMRGRAGGVVGGSVLVAGIIGVFFFVPYNASNPANSLNSLNSVEKLENVTSLPSEIEMQEFYDLHETHAQSHFTQIQQVEQVATQ